MSNETARAIGTLEATVSLTNRRIDDLRRELLTHIMLLYRLHRKPNGNGRKMPWLQLAAMGTVALTSLLGLLKPETAAMILRAILH